MIIVEGPRQICQRDTEFPKDLNNEKSMNLDIDRQL